MESTVEQISKAINESNNIVFFGGAGLSTESGIPDFRSVDGIYNQEYEYPPEQILSYSFFKKNPEVFFKFCREKCLKPIINAKPNPAHIALAKLEEMGKLKAVVTQNIDGLHQAAGSKEVLEIHGTLHSHTCIDCGKKYTLDYVLKTEGIPRCECGGIVRPDIVMYEEGLDTSLLERSILYISNADCLIVSGSSLVVQPAASLINYYRGSKLILINKDPLAADKYADYYIHAKAGETFKQIMEYITS